MRVARLLMLGLLGFMAASPAFSAEPLGRLFLTPERRAALERLRQFNIQETEQVIEGNNLSVSGVVQRSSGRRTTWVNGLPQSETDATSGIHIEVDPGNPARATLTSGEEAPASLKVGEAINRTTGETRSGIGSGEIRVERRGPAAR